MIPQPIAVTGNGNDNRVMQEAIKQGRCHHRITEHHSPIGKTQVGGEDHGFLLITGIDQLEEETGPATTTREKGTTQIKQLRLKSMKPQAPFWAQSGTLLNGNFGIFLFGY